MRSSNRIVRYVFVGALLIPGGAYAVDERPDPSVDANAGCGHDLGAVVDIREVRPLTDLLDRVRGEGVQFNLATEGAGVDATYALAVRRGSAVLGSFLILKDETISDAPVPAYETHAILGARGLGIGAMLYVLSARVVHRRGGTLTSTDVTEQSPDARALWDRLELFGWAERVPGRDRYRIRPDLLRAGFFDAVDALLDH